MKIYGKYSAKLNYVAETNLRLKFNQNSAKPILKLLQHDRKCTKNKQTQEKNTTIAICISLVTEKLQQQPNNQQVCTST